MDTPDRKIFTDDDVKKDIARRIKYWRIQAKLTPSELADAIGCTKGNISRWENLGATPSIVSVHKIATACNVSLAIFLGASLPEELAA